MDSFVTDTQALWSNGARGAHRDMVFQHGG